MIHTWIFGIEPVPASRPRVGRWSTYYPKRYSRFIKQMKQTLTKQVKAHSPCSTPLRVQVQIRALKPKSTKRLNPLGDVDNFAKAVLDCCNQVIWNDDDQIIQLKITKRYSVVQSITLVVQDNYDLDETPVVEGIRRRVRKRTTKLDR